VPERHHAENGERDGADQGRNPPSHGEVDEAIQHAATWVGRAHDRRERGAPVTPPTMASRAPTTVAESPHSPSRNRGDLPPRGVLPRPIRDTGYSFSRMP